MLGAAVALLLIVGLVLMFTGHAAIGFLLLIIGAILGVVLVGLVLASRRGGPGSP